jgi:PmbA protein
MIDHQNLAIDILAELKRQGADETDIVIVDSTNLNVNVRLGKIEKIEEAGSKGLGIRAFKRSNSNGSLSTALTYTSDFSDRSLKQLVTETLNLAAVTSPDECNGLPPRELQGTYYGLINLFDEKVKNLSTDEKIQRAKEVEDIGMQYDKRITNSSGAWWNDDTSQIVYANSYGFVGTYKTTSCGFGVSLVGEHDGVMQTAGWWHSHRCLDKLEDAKQVGEEAARRTVRKLGARKVKTQTVPVVYDPMVGADFLEIIFNAISGASIYRKSSFLLDKLGKKIAVESLNVYDDAIMPDGPASRPFDAEGVKSDAIEVIKDGALQLYLCDAYSARKLHRTPTGSASRGFSSAPTVSPNNFYMKPGNYTREEIIKSVKHGLYLTNLYWTGVNPVTGDYSRGAEGIWIEHGEPTYPVQEIIVAGNLLTMMHNITMIGNDLDFRTPIAAPTFLVSEMVVSGS